MITILVTIGVLIAITISLIFVYYYHFWIPKNRPFEVIGCVLTADNNIINISFKINKTGIITKEISKIHIIDEETGIKLYLLSLPKFGKMITRKDYKGRYGYMMFLNIGHVVKHDSKISVNIGDYQKKHVAVI